MTDTTGSIYYDDMETPIGTLRLVADDRGLREIRFAEPRHPRETPATWVRASGPLAAARAQLQEYFAGKRQQFDLPSIPSARRFS